MVYQKRSEWCFRDEKGKLHRFATQSEALAAAGKGSVEPEIEDADKDSYEIDEPVEE